MIDASAVTTEFNTLFETVTSIAEQVDPVKLNQTLAAAADGLTGLGDRFGESLENGGRILADLNPQMPQIAEDTRELADLADVYAGASPHLWDALEDAVRTSRTFNEHRTDIDQALMAAVGFAGESFERGGPYLVRGAADLVPSTQLLDDYRGMIFCTVRKFSVVQKRPPRCWAATATRWRRRRARSGAAAIRTSIPTICRGRTPTAAPKAVQGVGRTSRGNCGLRRIW